MSLFTLFSSCLIIQSVLFTYRYVKTVPLVAHTLDVRRSQKLEMVKELNREKSRYRLEVEIGKSASL